MTCAFGGCLVGGRSALWIAAMVDKVALELADWEGLEVLPFGFLFEFFFDAMCEWTSQMHVAKENGVLMMMSKN